jgi:hypothetical protein
VKYEFPRFFGITKTLRPVFSPPEEDEELLADALDDADDDDDELDEPELQAARATLAARGRASASHLARLFAISLYPFNLPGFLVHDLPADANLGARRFP